MLAQNLSTNFDTHEIIPTYTKPFYKPKIKMELLRKINWSYSFLETVSEIVYFYFVFYVKTVAAVPQLNLKLSI